jgi:hypothetical protein
MNMKPKGIQCECGKGFVKKYNLQVHQKESCVLRLKAVVESGVGASGSVPEATASFTDATESVVEAK